VFLPCAADVAWEPSGASGTAPTHKFTLRLGLPLLAFQAPIDWQAELDGDGPGCAAAHSVVVELLSDSPECEDCRAIVTSREDNLVTPVAISITPPKNAGPDSIVQRRVTWEGAAFLDVFTDVVRIDNPWYVDWDPAWRVIETLVLILVAAAASSAVSVRSPTALADESRAVPIGLAIIDDSGRARSLVRGGLIVWRDSGNPEGAPTMVSLRFFLAGPLVERPTDPSANWSSWLRGEPFPVEGTRIHRYERTRAP